MGTANTCVPVGSDDATCAAISAAAAHWDATTSACVACVDTADCTGTDVCSTVTANTCVAVGSDDATCAAISAAAPVWSGTACVSASTTAAPTTAAPTTAGPHDGHDHSPSPATVSAASTMPPASLVTLATMLVAYMMH